MFEDMDDNVREMGVGDVSVGAEVKRMARSLLGRVAAYDAALESHGEESGKEDLEAALEETGTQKLRREGGSQSGWVVVDFADLVIHLFGAEERDYYNLAGAWPGANEVVRIQ